MKTFTFNNGDEMPILGLGTWKAESGEVYKAVKEAIKLGYRHIDCAFIYGNEAEIGQALSESFAEGVVTREEMWITSKLWNDMHAPEDVEPAIKDALANLQLDYLDLYLVHWPIALKKGVFLPETAEDMIPLAELPTTKTWEAMEALVEKGLCKYIGVSNFSVPKLKALVNEAQIKPVMNQIELHPYLQQPEMLEYCKANDIYITAYSPLGSLDRPPVLKANDEPILLEDPTIAAIAAERGVTNAQVLLGWAVNRGTSVIPKSVNPGRMKQNLEAADVVLTADDMQKIAALDRNLRLLAGGFWEVPDGPYSIAAIWDE